MQPAPPRRPHPSHADHRLCLKLHRKAMVRACVPRCGLGNVPTPVGRISVRSPSFSFLSRSWVASTFSKRKGKEKTSTVSPRPNLSSCWPWSLPCRAFVLDDGGRQTPPLGRGCACAASCWLWLLPPAQTCRTGPLVAQRPARGASTTGLLGCCRVVIRRSREAMDFLLALGLRRRGGWPH